MQIDIRRALDTVFVTRFLKSRMPLWYPGWQKTERVDIAVQRNFLHEFRSLALRYSVYGKINGQRAARILRAQVRATHHPETTLPRRTYRVASFLADHGFADSMYRPLAFSASTNMFLYENTDGEDLQHFFCPTVYPKRPAHPAATLLAYMSAIAERLRTLHTYRKAPGTFRQTAAFDRRQFRYQFGIVRKCHPKSLVLMKRALENIQDVPLPLRRAPYSVRNQRVTHGDFHLGNIVATAHGLRLIDFGDAAIRHPLFDVARFFVQLEFFTQLVYKQHAQAITDRARRAFYLQYFGPGAPTRTERYLIEYFSVTNLLQIMSIKSFDSNMKHRDTVMANYFSGVERHLQRLQSIVSA